MINIVDLCETFVASAIKSETCWILWKQVGRFNKITLWEVLEKRGDITAYPDLHLHLRWAPRRDLISTYHEWQGYSVACLACVSTAIINNRWCALLHDHSSLTACYTETSLVTQMLRFDTTSFVMTKYYHSVTILITTFAYENVENADEIKIQREQLFWYEME